MRQFGSILLGAIVAACGSTSPPQATAPASPAADAPTANLIAADAPPPCDSHTSCYLLAKEAHATGERSGYQIAVSRCEHYRRAYQLEKFYGLCLLILADGYQHLGDFDRAKDSFERVLDTQPDDLELMQQARDGLDELQAGMAHPELYTRYLEAVALLSRYNTAHDGAVLPKARALLADLERESPDWTLAANVRSMLEQIDHVISAGEEPSAEEAESEPSFSGSAGLKSPMPEETE